MKQTCSKKGFDTENLALARIKEIKMIVDERKKPSRAYRCTICGQWHLTSMSFSEVAEKVVARRGHEINRAIAKFKSEFKEKPNKVKKFKKYID